MTLRERIIIVFQNYKMQQHVLFNGYYPVRLPTHSIRNLLGNSHTCAEIRKELLNLGKDGYLHKDLYHSRRGNAVWRWDK